MRPGKASAENDADDRPAAAGVNSGVTAVTSRRPPVGRSYNRENGISPRQLLRKPVEKPPARPGVAARRRDIARGCRP